MIEILSLLRVASQSRQDHLTDRDKAQIQQLITWQQHLIEIVTKHPEPFQPSVQLLAEFLDCGSSDSIARQYANQMLVQYCGYLKKLGYLKKGQGFQTVDEWLGAINYVIQRAPRYKGQQFPMSSLFVFVMFTPSGAALFRLKQFNSLLTCVLQTWCTYLDSRDSLNVLSERNGWLSSDAQQKLCLKQSVNYLHRDEPHWGFQSFNAFFHREYQLKKYRPLSDPHDDKVIVSANDGTVYRIAKGVKLCDTFWTKGQKYSLREMLNGSPYTESFIGGDVLQSFLAGSDYHRWHAPISGKVLEARVIPGLMFSELLSEGFDISAGTKSQGYEAMVNTRGLIVIDSPTLGKMAVIPIGITEISSVTIDVSPGDEIKKGEEIGYFSYGGSSMALIFQKGQIKKFTAKKVQDPSQPSCKTVKNCKAGDGCLRVRAKVAIANVNF
ncbi:MAG: phophatidylserine decarboxylase associated domain-containing protein [Acidobacteriota bacterium]|nr:phophatidylserine decarboxylase associated domain-containing protein [Acidobacteriota bacterium]